MQRFQLLSQVAVTGPGSAVTAPAAEHESFLRAYQASLAGGTTATVQIEVSNDGKAWVVLAIMTFSPTNRVEGLSSEVPWGFVRGNVTALAAGGKVDASFTIGTQGSRQ